MVRIFFIVALSVLATAAQAQQAKEIAQWPATTHVNRSDNILLQQGPKGTAYTRGTPALIFGSMIPADVTGALGYVPLEPSGSGEIGPSLVGTFATGHIATYADTNGSLQDGGVPIGQSGAAIPRLDQSNTWSQPQTFAATYSAVTSQAGTTYTLQSTDCGSTIRFTNASAITLTAPNSLTQGCYANVVQMGAGLVTVSAGSGATVHSPHGFTKTWGQYAMIGLFVDANSGGSAADYILFGDGQ